MIIEVLLYYDKVFFENVEQVSTAFLKMKLFHNYSNDRDKIKHFIAFVNLLIYN